MNRVPPLRISGSARCAMRMKVQQDTSIVVRNPSRDTSTTRPCSASLGEKAIEWTTKSSLPQSLAIRSNTASISPGARTSSGSTIWPRAHGRAARRISCLVVEIGDRGLGPERSKRLGATPGNRLIVGDFDNKSSLPSSSFAFAVGIMWDLVGAERSDRHRCPAPPAARCSRPVPDVTLHRPDRSSAVCVSVSPIHAVSLGVRNPLGSWAPFP